jgi:type I restriction enzyme, S subunit
MIENMHVGTLIPHFKKGDFDKLILPIPTDYSFQEKIGDLYFDLSEKIELNRQTNITLESIAQALFREWFEEFHFPNATSKNKDSTSGNIPSDWTIHGLGEHLVSIIDGDRGKNYPKQGEFSDKGYCLFLNAKNVTDYGFNFSDCEFITKEKDESLNKGKLQRNDIVLTTRGTVGNIAYYDDFIPFDNIRINSGMVILRCEEFLYPYYLLLFLKSSFFFDQMRSLVSGSAQPQFPIRDIKKVKIVIPDIDTMNQFRKLLSPIEYSISRNNQENSTLAEIRKELLPKLINGEIEL